MERNMEHELGLEFLRVVEAAAIASAHTMGTGERKYSDHVAVELDAPVKDNLHAIARRLNRDIEDLVVSVLDRPRHQKLIADIREAGARIRLITDGDLSAGISAAVAGSGVHAVMGIGGAPEGVLTAAAMKSLNGQILARFVLKEQLEDLEDRERIGGDAG